MTAEYKIYPDDKLIVATYSGVFTVADILGLRQRIMQDPDYQSDFHVLDDVTRVEKVDADFNQLTQIPSGIIIQKGIRRALVAKTDLQFGMARTYQMLSENAGHQFELFRDFDEALAWVKNKT